MTFPPPPVVSSHDAKIIQSEDGHRPGRSSSGEPVRAQELGQLRRVRRTLGADGGRPRRRAGGVDHDGVTVDRQGEAEMHPTSAGAVRRRGRGAPCATCSRHSETLPGDHQRARAAAGGPGRRERLRENPFVPFNRGEWRFGTLRRTRSPAPLRRDRVEDPRTCAMSAPPSRTTFFHPASLATSRNRRASVASTSAPPHCTSAGGSERTSITRGPSHASRSIKHASRPSAPPPRRTPAYPRCPSTPSTPAEVVHAFAPGRRRPRAPRRSRSRPGSHQGDIRATPAGTTIPTSHESSALSCFRSAISRTRPSARWPPAESPPRTTSRGSTPPPSLETSHAYAANAASSGVSQMYDAFAAGR